MNSPSFKGVPSAAPGGASGFDSGVPYAFEKVMRDGGGVEAARLEAQNLLLEKADPMAQLPSLPPDGSVLDLGSGTGFWSLRLARLVPQGRVTCLDRSEELLALARRRLESGGFTRTAFLHQDLRSLQLQGEHYDLVFTSVTLAHVRELDGVLGQVAASLKPGGWVACLEPIQQNRRFCDIHPPCPELEFLMERLTEVIQERGTDMAVALKIAHTLERLGLEGTVLRDYGKALHGEDVVTCVRDVFLPLARAYLHDRLEAADLDRHVQAALQEGFTPHLWMDFRRAVVLGRKPS